MVTKIYFIRHAEAMGNINETFQGRTDAGVTEKGYKQLNALSVRMKDIHLDKIYTSPLMRTRETAKAVNKYHNLDIIINDSLIEINGGQWENKKWADIPKLFPEQYNAWAKKMQDFNVPDGESMHDVYGRMIDAVNDILSQSKGKSVAVVSHGCAIRNYLSYAEFGSINGINDVGWSDNTGVSLVEYDDDLKPKLIFKNNSEHLPLELSTLAYSDWCKSQRCRDGQS